MSLFKKHRRIGYAEMRPYIQGESLNDVSLSEEDTPSKGGMIARNSDNHKDQWYVAEQWFIDNYEMEGEDI